MSAILLLANGDADLSKGGLQLCDGQQQVLQAVRSALRSFQGEWFLDVTQGLPYFQTILQKGTGQDVIEGLFRAAILAVDGILEVVSLTFTPNARARTGSLVFVARTATGTINSTVTV